MEFIIEDGILKDCIGSDEDFKEIRVPDGVHTIASGAVCGKRDHPGRQHIILPDTVQKFEHDSVFTGLTVNDGSVITLPASVYQQINYDLATNRYSPNPYYGEAEIRFDIVKEDGERLELYFVNDPSNYPKVVDNFWTISDFSTLKAKDFNRYDDYIDEANLTEKNLNADQKVRVRISRLLRPYMLNAKNKKLFVEHVCKNASRAAKYAAAQDDPEILQLLFDIQAITAKNKKKMKDLIFEADAPKCQAAWETVESSNI